MSFMKVPRTGAPPTVEDWCAPNLPVRVPVDRIRYAAMRLGLAIALITFVVSSSPILLDQWISGHESAFFMLGTMLVLLGFSVGLFGAILGIGLVISVFFGAAHVLERSFVEDVHILTGSTGHRAFTGVAYGVEN